MKTTDFLLAVLVLFLLSFTTIKSNAQIQVTSGVDPVEMVEMILGPGVVYDNVQYNGADVARGTFSNGNSTDPGFYSGAFLTSGAGFVIPGPNSECSSGYNNGMGGDDMLSWMIGSNTYDAAVLQFDFAAQTDTFSINYVFGSEEYNEYVNSTFNDVFAIVITGPNPAGGVYVNENIATIPDNPEMPVLINNINNGWASCGVVPTGPCTNCEYFKDNTSGVYLEYDGLTTPLTAWIPVIPNEFYHLKIAIADAGDHLFDSGLFLEGAYYSDFQYFGFLMENNPALTEDIEGIISDSTVSLNVPSWIDVTDLVATFDVQEGIEVYVGDSLQQSGVTHNDFTEPLTYYLSAKEGKSWTVTVDFYTGIESHIFSDVNIHPNPTSGKFKISDIKGFKVKILNSLGAVIQDYGKINKKEIIVTDLIPGFYFVVLEKDGFTETRKVIVR